jgi:aminopeptidase N
MKSPLASIALAPLTALGALLLLSGGCRTQPSIDEEAGPDGRGDEAAAGLDVEHYAIELVLHPGDRRIEGRCRVRLYPATSALTEVTLDLAGLQVRGVTDETGRPLDFVHLDAALVMQLAEPLSPGEYTELAIHYGGRPSGGLCFSGERPDGSGPTQVFSLGESRSNRGWFPCSGDPSDHATSEVRVTMPAGWISMAAGESVDRRQESGQVIEHWRMSTPHPSHLVTLAAGEFIVRESDWEGVPLLFVAEPHHARLLEASLRETDEILAFFSDYTGVRYPYPKYSQTVVANFPGSGMESISATTLPSQILDDERGRRDGHLSGLVAREAAQQWFGALVSCREWSHLWLTEGLSSYLALLWVEHSLGLDEFRARMRDTQLTDLTFNRGARRQPMVWEGWKEVDDLLSPPRIEGAAARLHLLRFLLGDQVFRAAIQTFVAENAGRSVDTEDFRRTLEKVSGRDLGEFFAQWILGVGHPELELAWSWNSRSGTVRLDVRQVQEARHGTPAVFRFPVEVEFLEDGGTRAHRIEITERRQSFELPADGKPLYVRFDKHGWVPMVVSWKRPAAQWLAIASHDDDVNGRRRAVVALGDLAGRSRTGENLAAQETYVAQIITGMRNDSSVAVRVDAARALAAAGGLEARERLMEVALESEAAGVRVAALQSLEAWGEDPRIAELARVAFDQGYSWATMGAAAGLVCRADPEGAYAWITGRLLIDSPHDQLTGYLLEHLGSLSNRAATGQLLRWARDDSVHPTARAVALRQLPRRDRDRVSNARAVAEFLDSPSFLLRQAAVQALAEFDSAPARRALEAHYPNAVTARERRTIEAALEGRR